MASSQVKGIDELTRKLAALAKKATPQQLEAALRSGALLIEGDAKRLAPYLTGTLRRSIHTETSSDRGGAQARVGTNVEYAPHLEFGTRRQRPQPYLRPAFDGAKNRVRQEVADALKDMVKP
jgi:HK97 gp10 family phage protein